MKAVMLSSLAIFLFTSPALADFGGGVPSPGGFVGPSNGAAQTAIQVLTARDDTPVILQGRIVEHIGKDKYTFEDSTGRLTVEIDRDVFGVHTVTPQTLLRLTGEVDSEFFRRNEVDVDVLEVLHSTVSTAQ